MIGVGINVSQNQQSKTVVYDSFNRPDANTLGTTETGQQWENLKIGSIMSISNGAAYLSGGTVDSLMVVNPGINNFSVSCNITNLTNNAGLAVRTKAVGQYYLVRLLLSTKGVEILRIGTETTVDAAVSLGSKTGLTEINSTANNRLRVVCNGDKIEAYLNGIKQVEVTDSVFTQYTKCGFRSGSSDYTSKYDNFEVRKL